MSKLLIPEPPLQVIPSLAVMIGLNEAIVLQQVHYRGLRQDGGWVEKSVGEWATEFPFWSESTVKRVFTQLRGELGLLESEKATRPLDQTNRYRVNEAALEALRSAQSDPMDGVNLTSSQIGSDRPDASGQVDPVSIGSTQEEATAEKKTDGELVLALRAFEHWRQAFSLNGTTRFIRKRRDKVIARLRSPDMGPTPEARLERLIAAIDFVAGSQWHRERGHIDLELIARSDSQVEQYLLRADATTATAATKPDRSAYDQVDN